MKNLKTKFGIKTLNFEKYFFLPTFQIIIINSLKKFEEKNGGRTKCKIHSGLGRLLPLPDSAIDPS